MKRREQKQIDVLATARRDRRRVPLPFCLPRPPLSPLSFHTRTWIQGMRKWVPSPTGSGAMPETRSYMTARSPPSTLREKGRNVCECGLWRPVPQISRHMLGKQMQSNIGVGSEGACEDSRACACATPGAGNGGRKKQHDTHTPVYRVDVSTWPVTPAAMAQAANFDKDEATAMACGEGAAIGALCGGGARSDEKRSVCAARGGGRSYFVLASSFILHSPRRAARRTARSLNSRPCTLSGSAA